MTVGGCLQRTRKKFIRLKKFLFRSKYNYFVILIIPEAAIAIYYVYENKERGKKYLISR